MRKPDWKPTLDDPVIRNYLLAHGGDRGVEIYEFIKANEPVPSQDILDHFQPVVEKEIRKALYSLMESHALEYATEMDQKGWMTFHWQTDMPEVKLVLMRAWEAQRKELKRLIHLELSHEWYSCPKCNFREMFEDAMDTEFKCPNDQTPLESSPHDVENLEAALHALDPK